MASSKSTLFTVLPTWMGSDGIPSTSDRARVATKEYESLISRVGGVADDREKSRLVDWVGSWNIPGSPAERYAVVVSDLKDSQPDPVLQAKRVSDLENVLLEFRAEVSKAEAAYGTVTAADRGQVLDASGELTGKGIAVVAVAIASFLILPFLMD